MSEHRRRVIGGRAVAFLLSAVSLSGCTHILASHSPAPVAPTCECQTDSKPVRVTVLGRDGRPIAGAVIYSSKDLPYNRWPAVFIEPHVADASGSAFVTSSNSGSHRLAVSPDRHVATAPIGKTIVFGPEGAVSLRLVDDQRQPIANHLVVLAPTQDATPWRGYSWLGFDHALWPQQKDVFSGTTNASGWLRLPHLPLGSHFRVGTQLNDKSMIFTGSVRPGKPVVLMINHDCEVVGHVFDRRGSPVVGATVQLGYCRFEEGVPNDLAPIAIGVAHTDHAGAYSIHRMPNCELVVEVGLPGKTPDDPEAIRINRGKWTDEFYRVDIISGRTVCDVRMKSSRPKPNGNS